MQRPPLRTAVPFSRLRQLLAPRLCLLVLSLMGLTMALCTSSALADGPLAWVSPAVAVPTIATVVGDPFLAGSATSIGQAPNAIASAPGGALYAASEEQGIVRAINPTNGEETVVAGDGGEPGNGAHAFSASEPKSATEVAMQPQAIAVDAEGNLFIGDGNNSRPGGVGLLAAANCASDCPFGLTSMTKGDIYAIAGGETPSNGSPGNGDPGSSVAVEPVALAVDAAGDVIMAQNICYERSGTSLCGGVVSVIAAHNCSSSCPFAIEPMTAGDIYTIAGGGVSPLHSGEAATSGSLGYLSGVGINSAGDVAMTTDSTGDLSEIGEAFLLAAQPCSTSCPFGLSSMTKGAVYVVGGGGANLSANGEPATNARLDPLGAFFDASGDLLTGDGYSHVTRLIAGADCSSSCPFGLSSLVAGDVYTIAGGGSTETGNGGSPTATKVTGTSFALDSTGDLLIGDPYNDWVRLIAAANCASDCPFGLPSLTKNDLYTVAGNGTRYSGSGAPADEATLDGPTSLAAEDLPEGSVFVDDTGDERVAMIAGKECTGGHCGFGLPETLPGHIYTIAGGVGGYNDNIYLSTSGENATSGNLPDADGLAVDADGDAIFSSVSQVLLLARHDCSSACPFGLPAMSEGYMYTIAGTFEDAATGEEGPATSAGIGDPEGAIALDSEGNLFIGSPEAGGVRMVAAATCASDCPFGLAKTVKGDIYRIAGGGSSVNSGSTATAISLAIPTAIAVDSTGDMLVANYSDGLVWLIARSSCSGSCPFGLPSTEQGHAYIVTGVINGPDALTLDHEGNLLIGQEDGPAVRMVANTNCASDCPYGLTSMARGSIYGVAGDGTAGYSGDGGPAVEAEFSGYIGGLAVNNAGELLISDSYGSRIRAVSATGGKGETPSEEGTKEQEEDATKSEEQGGGSFGGSTGGSAGSGSNGSDTSTGSTGTSATHTKTQTTSTTKQTKQLTLMQKLAKALKVCRKLKKAKRAKCEKTARKRYQPKKKSKEKAR